MSRLSEMLLISHPTDNDTASKHRSGPYTRGGPRRTISPNEIEIFRFGTTLLVELFVSPNDTTIQGYDGHLWGRDLLNLVVGSPLSKSIYLNWSMTLQMTS